MNFSRTGTSQAIETFHTREYTTFISQIGFVNPGQVKVLFNSPNSASHLSDDIHAILIAGKAKIAALEGDFYLAQSHFKSAFSLADKATTFSDNQLAYIHYEYGLFYLQLLSSNLANEQFLLAQKFNTSAKLATYIDYQLELISIKLGTKHSLNRLFRLVDGFKAKNQTIMHILGLKRLGNFLRDRREFDESDQAYREALYLAEQGGFEYLVWAIKNSMGLLLHKRGNFKEAVGHYEGFINTVESHYLKALVMKNLALRYRVVGQVDRAIRLAKDALEYVQTHGVFSAIPGMALLSGKLICDYTDTPQEAFHYFKIGYDSSLEQEEKGLPLTGPRLRAVKEYADYVTSYMPENFNKIAVTNYFQWAQGKSWVLVQDLFFYNLFVYHFIHTGIGKKTFTHLGLNPTTFYSTAKRMRDKRGISFPNFKDVDMSLAADLYIDSLQKYIQLHRDKTYAEISELFESEIYEFLFKESGYNKKRLSDSLDLSYSVVLKKTKAFTDISDSYTQSQLKAPSQISISKH